MRREKGMYVALLLTLSMWCGCSDLHQNDGVMFTTPKKKVYSTYIEKKNWWKPFYVKCRVLSIDSIEPSKTDTLNNPDGLYTGKPVYVIYAIKDNGQIYKIFSHKIERRAVDYRYAKRIEVGRTYKFKVQSVLRGGLRSIGMEYTLHIVGSWYYGVIALYSREDLERGVNDTYDGLNLNGLYIVK